MKTWFGTLAAMGLGGWLASAAQAQAIPPPVDLGSTSIASPAPSQRAGGFVQRPLGRDEHGNPIVGTVYQAGSRQRSEWRRSTRGRWYAGRRAAPGGGLHISGGYAGQPVWLVGAGGWCYPAAWGAAGLGAWPVVIGGGPAGGFSLIVSF